jgi:hypothetical protein
MTSPISDINANSRQAALLSGVVARYILENPIRAGLSTVLGEYTLAGSGMYVPQELRDLWQA